MLDKSSVLIELLKLFGESSLLTELYVWKDREMNEIVIAIKKSRIFSGEYVVGSGCLVQVSKVNSEFIVKPIQYNVDPKVESEEVKNYEKTYAKAEPTARLMLTSLEPRNHSKGSTSYKGKLVYWRVINHAKVLAKPEVSNGADVDERMEALQRAKYALYDLISYGPQKNLVAGFKELSYPLKGQITVLWDIENCQLPSKFPTKDVSKNIIRYLKQKTNSEWDVISISAYGDLSRIPLKKQEDLKSTGVNLINIWNGKKKKDAADIAIMGALHRYAFNNPAPSPIMLITGDIDYTETVCLLHDKGHYLILATPSRVCVSPDLTNACDVVWSWSNVLRGEDPSSSSQIKEPFDSVEASMESQLVSEVVPSSSSQTEKGQLAAEKLSDNVGVSKESPPQPPPVDFTGLKDELVKLLEDFKEGLHHKRLPMEYQKMFKKSIHLRANNLGVLLKKMSDVISVEYKEGKKFVKLKK